jgi:release factor glutamine methyltransferase
MHPEPHPHINLSEAIEMASHGFKATSDTARLDAGTLLGHILGKPRTWVAAHTDYLLNDHEYKALRNALAEVAAGIPLPYIVGHWEFYGLDFVISRDVLIPRPETEIMVDMGLKWLLSNPGRRVASDVGTGSGCIAVSLAVNLPELSVFACDISKEALRIANKNIRKHEVENQVTLIRGDLLADLPEPVDILFANLPYIPDWKLDGLRVSKHEPRLALDGGPDGLSLIRRLILQCEEQVIPGGAILLEIEAGQGSEVVKLVQETFPTAEVCCHQDLAGMDRIISILLPGGPDKINDP